MHIDEGKKFDKRNVAANIKGGVITKKEYEIYLAKLPDASEKLYDSEFEGEPEELESADEMELKRKEGKKKAKGRGK